MSQVSLEQNYFAGRALAITCLLLAIALLAAGCAATRVDVLWSNPDFAARKIEGKLMVVGLTQDEAMRRVYEDALALRLTARGVGVIRSYEIVQGAFGADGNKAILDAARRQGATAVLSSAVVGHEHIKRVTVDDTPMRWHGAYEGWYSHYWPYLYRHTEVSITERYYASTTLIDVASSKISWTVRTHTDATGNAERDIKEFAGVVLDTMAKGALI